LVHNSVVEKFFDSVPNFKRTRGNCYTVINGYANLRFNKNYSLQLKDGKRAEEEKFSKKRCRWFEILATTMVYRE